MSNTQNSSQSPFSKFKQMPTPTQVESMCPRCHQNGMTTLLMVNIPMFRQFIIASFRCEHCGQNNREVQFAGKLQDLGIEVLFRCLKPQDLNRQVIKSDHCHIQFEELQLQIPSKRAEITTIQSLLRRAAEDLQHNQQHRQKNDPQTHKQVQVFICRLRDYALGRLFPLTLKLKDPSGNSFMKNPNAPRIDKAMEVSYFRRTLQQLTQMGYSLENAQEQLRIQKEREDQIVGNKLNFEKPFEEQDFARHQAMSFEVDCQACGMPGEMKSCRTAIPYFTDLLIMSFKCDYCGHHSTDTKNSSEMTNKALTITLKASDEQDLKRQLFKSQTCSVQIPELELQLDYGTLGGILTTVEGLLQKIHQHLGLHNPFVDSDNQFGVRMRQLLAQLQECGQGKRPFTLLLVDPLGRSFLQNPKHPEQDKNATRELRERTFDENQMLGLNDIKVENYKQ